LAVDLKARFAFFTPIRRDLTDSIGIDGVYKVCSFLPVVGLLTIFLPEFALNRTESRDRSLIEGAGTTSAEHYGERASINGVFESTRAPWAPITTCCSSLIPSGPPTSPI
jgi:hypothetical protein